MQHWIFYKLLICVAVILLLAADASGQKHFTKARKLELRWVIIPNRSISANLCF